MSGREPKYLVGGDRPVNRRTAAHGPAPAPKVAPTVVERVRAAQARNRLGAPLAEQLRAPAAAPRDAPLRPQALAGGIVAAAGGLGLFIAWLQASLVAGLLGGAGLAGGLLLAQVGRRRDTGLASVPAPPLFDRDAVDAFDRVVQQLAGTLPPGPAERLAAIKQVVVRMARHPGAGTVDEHFLLEDRLYASECLRRYLPDTLQAWLAIPREQRSAPLADGRSADGLLAQQLALLQAELEQREARLARSAAEALLRQQRFLDAKRRHEIQG